MCVDYRFSGSLVFSASSFPVLLSPSKNATTRGSFFFGMYAKFIF